LFPVIDLRKLILNRIKTPRGASTAIIKSVVERELDLIFP